jgi:hypothetical protein
MTKYSIDNNGIAIPNATSTGDAPPEGYTLLRSDGSGNYLEQVLTNGYVRQLSESSITVDGTLVASGEVTVDDVSQVDIPIGGASDPIRVKIVVPPVNIDGGNQIRFRLDDNESSEYRYYSANAVGTNDINTTARYFDTVFVSPDSNASDTRFMNLYIELFILNHRNTTYRTTINAVNRGESGYFSSKCVMQTSPIPTHSTLNMFLQNSGTIFPIGTKWAIFKADV